MPSERHTYRAVLVNGSIREVEVFRWYPAEGEPDERARYEITDPWEVYRTSRAKDPLSAVLIALRNDHVNYIELRGPGELTTAEAVEAAVQAQQKQCKWWMCGRKCNPNGTPRTAEEDRALWGTGTPGLTPDAG
jgi:hypothetical protein